jgi:hypothetical protein
MVPALCGYPLQTRGFSGLSPLSRFPGLHRETTTFGLRRGTELYVMFSHTTDATPQAGP